MQTTTNNTTITTKAAKKGNLRKSSTTHSIRSTKRVTKSTKVNETGNEVRKRKFSFARKLTGSKSNKVIEAPTKNTTITTKDTEELTDPMFIRLARSGVRL